MYALGINSKVTNDLFEKFDAERYHYRHLFPLLDAPAVQLATHYDEMGPDLTTVPPLEIMKIVTNKLLFNNWLRENGFEENAPKVYDSVDAIEKYPVIIKPLNGTGSERVRAVRHRDELDWYLLKNLQNRPYVLQEAIENRFQRIIHVSAIDGRMQRMVCYERDLEQSFGIYPNKWKTTPPAIPNKECYMELFMRVLEKISFTGIGDFDVKLKKEHNKVTPMIIEFNPRIPGTIRRDENLLADFICSIQWNGTGVLTSSGCILPQH